MHADIHERHLGGELLGGPQRLGSRFARGDSVRP